MKCREHNTFCLDDQEFFEGWEEGVVLTGECVQYYYENACDLHTSYAPVQSYNNLFIAKPPKYCADFNGTRLFGDAAYDDDDVTCACSRKYWELTTYPLASNADGVTRHGKICFNKIFSGVKDPLYK